ncbi:MAG: CBS domain-containing protein [Halobacteriota archaeon]|nr:CBS domain-containing protein [Halobacteriota archaeon]
MEIDYKVRDVMIEDVISVTVPGARDNVLKIFKDKQVSGVPAIKENGDLVGIVTRVDLLHHPEEEQIALLMTRDPITIGPEENLSEAARLLVENKIRRLPVVGNGNLIGIITIADIIKVISTIEDDGTIESCVYDGVISIWDETPLPVVGKIMELASIAAAPLINSNQELSGIITDRDLINRAVIEDYVEKSDMSAGSDEDAWTWESMRDTMKMYYGVSKISMPNIPVKDIMVTDLITEFYGAETSECAKLMVKHNIDQIPIVSPNQRLVGLLLDKDLIRCLL